MALKKPLTSTARNLQLVRAGREYFDLLLTLISNAINTIHLQTYILDDDETGQKVADALIGAAKRNVQVYVMADGYGSQWLSGKYIEKLTEAGVNFRYFEPFFRSKQFYFGRRMHHKVFVADAWFSLVGGINIADRYNTMPGIPAWLDFALYAEGDISKELCTLCWKTWNGFMTPKKTGDCLQPEKLTATTNGNSIEVRMRRNDWVRRKNEISGSYIQMMREAKSHITIVCSYFLPGRILRRAMTNAARRNVRVRVVIAGSSDISIAKNAERWLYNWLLRNKIELYEYQPRVLHAKLALCDGQWLTVGSYNLNDLSTYASIELNIDVFNPAFCKEAEKTIETIIKNDCLAITPELITKKRNVIRQFFHWSSYQLVRGLLFAFTFYYRQTEKKQPVVKQEKSQ